jgi:glycosyltransferase involved in cell wall biosynthesis
MRILVLPYEESTPYQRLLYTEMRRQGAQVSYLGELTPSHTLNLLLLPLELMTRRITGGRVVHLHWTYAFSWPGSRRIPALRTAAYVWFAVCLTTIRVAGLRLVWTAHNVLPHEPVFADDIRARQRLARACDLVIAHSPSALAELAALGVQPGRMVVIPHGPLSPPVPATSLRSPGAGSGPRRLLYFGKVRDYKGVEDLLAAFAALPGDAAVRLTVAGECPDQRLRAALDALAPQARGRVTLRLQRVPDEEVSGLLASADAVVLPYRRVTTSGTAMLALAHGRPLIVPDLASLSDLPAEAVLRYDGTVAGLTEALITVCRAGPDVIAAMSAAAREFSDTMSWPAIAAKTMTEMAALVSGECQTDPQGSARMAY